MNFRNQRTLLICLLLLAQCVAARAQTPKSSGYRMVKKFAVGGDGGWDYLVVDARARRLYVTRSTHVMVLDADSGAVVGDIPETPGVHGVALATDLGRGFTSNGRAASVTVFDLKTLKVLQQVKVGQNPDAILYDAATRRVFVFNGASHDATVIDAATGAVAGTIPLGGKPEAGVADGKGHVFVNVEDTSEVVKLDSRKLAAEARWTLAPCEEPTGMAMDHKSRRLFVGCSNKLMAVVNADTGRLVTTLPVGGGVDGDAFDPATGLAFSANGEGSVTVVHEDSPDKFSVVDTVTTQAGARTIALDEKGHRVFLATAMFGPTPPPTTERPRPRPSIVPGSFVVLVVGK